MSSRVAPPRFGSPPKEYDQTYFDEITRQFSLLVSKINNKERFLSDLPTNNINLKNGALYQHDGFVKVTVANEISLSGITATGSIGTVSVTV